MNHKLSSYLNAIYDNKVFYHTLHRYRISNVIVTFRPIIRLMLEHFLFPYVAKLENKISMQDQLFCGSCYLYLVELVFYSI